LNACVAERTQVTTINVLRSEEAPVYDDTWVMVFGFLTDRSVLAAVLQEFQLCGTIVLWVTPPAANCNWIYIQFETPEGAHRALKKSGQRLGMLPMVIGVQPLSPEDRRFIAQQSANSWTSRGDGSLCSTKKFCFVKHFGKGLFLPAAAHHTYSLVVHNVADVDGKS
jgi:Nup53/35/40-type RNA recognition motif